MQYLKNILTMSVVSLTLLMSTTMLFAPYASAQLFNNAKNQACQGTNLSGSAGCNPSQTNRVNQIITNGINLFSVVIGITAVVMIIVGGFKFIASNGDANGVASAKKTIIYAVIGLVIVAFAQVIVRFVINETNQVTQPEKESSLYINRIV